MVDAAHPAWAPRNEDELREALNTGGLEERHLLELKREVGLTPAARKELARDLASLANDGGRLYIGIDEGDPKCERPPSTSPIDLDGLAERVEQIALSGIDPPLTVTFRQVASDDSEGLGYLMVDVPASPLAPHMVGNVYWGRGDKTKDKLSDGDVARLMERRRRWERDVLDLLDAEVGRDPVPADRRTNGHMFIIAEPVVEQGDALAGALGAEDWEIRVRQLIVDVGAGDNSATAPVKRLRLTRGAVRRSGGAGVAHGLAGDRTAPPFDDVELQEGDVTEVEGYENGGLRLFDAGAVVVKTSGVKVVPVEQLIAQVRHVLAACHTVAQAVGHHGGYDLAVAITDINGAVSSELRRRADTAPAYPTSEYRKSTRASAAELASRRGEVVERLLGGLIRSLGVAQLQEVTTLYDDGGIL